MSNPALEAAFGFNSYSKEDQDKIVENLRMKNNMEKYDVNEASQAQAEYQKKTNSPDFAPHNGICWSCRENIYKQLGWKNENYRSVRVPLDSPELKYTTGISVEKAGASLVTGCPHCNRSYCD